MRRRKLPDLCCQDDRKMKELTSAPVKDEDVDLLLRKREKIVRAKLDKLLLCAWKNNNYEVRGLLSEMNAKIN